MYLILALGLIGFGLYLLVETNDTIMTTMKLYNLIILGAGILMLFTGTIGLFGICRKKSLCLGIYNFSLIPWALVFLALALFFFSIAGSNLVENMK